MVKFALLVTQPSTTKSTLGVRFGSSGRVRNAMIKFKKAESLRRMANIEGRLNHIALVEEQRAKKLERSTEKARLHLELLEKQKALKAERLAKTGPTKRDEERKKAKVEAQQKRAAERLAAREIIQQATAKIAELRAVPRTEAY